MKKRYTTLAENISWGEALRWHDNRLWFSDIFGKEVCFTDLNGTVEKVLTVPGMPSGLGFLPDNSLLIVSGDGSILHLKDEKATEYASLKAEAVGINDMVVTPNGNAYVGCYGFDITNYQGGEATGWVTLITPDGQTKQVGFDLQAPNGMVLTNDGQQLIVADTFASQLVVYDIQADGTLANPSVWATLDAGPDGITIDNEGCIWAAIPNKQQVVCVEKGGHIKETLEFTSIPLCCELADKDTKKLFVVTVPVHDELRSSDLTDVAGAQEKQGSKILMLDVAVYKGA